MYYIIKIVAKKVKINMLSGNDYIECYAFYIEPNCCRNHQSKFALTYFYIFVLSFNNTLFTSINELVMVDFS